jgi:hypothetical protein
VAAKAESLAAEQSGFEAGPAADARGLAVRADQVAMADGLAIDLDFAVVAEGGAGCPFEVDADFFCAMNEALVEYDAAHAEAFAAWELASHEIFAAVVAVGEVDAGEFSAAGEFDAKAGEFAAGVGHEAFAAGLVDGRDKGFDDEDIESLLANGDGGGEAGWASADDQGVEDAGIRCSDWVRHHWGFHSAITGRWDASGLSQ